MTDTLTAGTGIYYGGDMANESGFGTITRADGADCDIEMNDGRVIRMLPLCAFSAKYEGHGGTRFVTKAAYKAWYDEKMARWSR